MDSMSGKLANTSSGNPDDSNGNKGTTKNLKMSELGGNWKG